MKNIILYLFIAILTSSSSCEKHEPSSRDLTIEGTLMANCNTPAANRSGYFHHTGGMTRYTWGEFTTDDNGYFKITEEARSYLTLTIGRNNHVLRNIMPRGNHLDLGKVYISPFPTNFIIHLNVRNPYTENDTLIIRDFWDSHPLAQLKIPGPFESTTLDSVINLPYTGFPLTWRNIVDGKTPEYTINTIVITKDSDQIIKYTHFNIAPICSGEYAEVTLVID